MLKKIPLALLLLPACGDPVVAWDYLSVINISPPGGAANIATDVQVAVTFSAALDPDTVNSDTLLLEDDDGSDVLAQVDYDDPTWSALLSPSAPLAQATGYTLLLSTGITSPTAGPLLAEVWSSFTTAGASPLNDLPVADAGEDLTVAVGDTVVLDGSASWDPEGTTLFYAWTLASQPEDSAATLASPSSVTPSFMADTEGDYTLSLVVNDQEYDSDPDYVVVTAE